MKFFLAILTSSFLLLAHSASAQGLATFSYQRGDVSILRAHPPLQAPLPWVSSEQPPTTEPNELKLSVDIRDIKSLYQQEGWMDLGGLSDTHGMLFILETSQPARIQKQMIYAPLDILWVDGKGKITSIAPNLVLADLSEPLFGKESSKAILLLAGGTCERESIAPADRVVNEEFFTPPLHILTAPE